MANTSTMVSKEDYKKEVNKKARTQENLNYSIQLLDEALGQTPMRGIGRTHSMPRFGFDRQKRQKTERGVLDVTAMSHMESPSTTLLEKHHTPSRMTDVTFSIGDTTTIVEDFDPVNSAIDSMFEEFFLATSNHPSELQLFDLVAEFEQFCCDTLDLVRQSKNRLKPSAMSAKEAKYKKLQQTYSWLAQERNTWRLVYSLYQDRVKTEAVSNTLEYGEGSAMESDYSQYLYLGPSELDVANKYYEANCFIRRCQLVIDWLERNERDEVEDPRRQRFEHFTDRTVAWENTIHALQNKESGIPFGSDRPIVTHVDPDAPIREQRPLHDLDQEDEARLLAYLFLLVRCGQLEEAQLLCSRCGQHWRAAALDGWRLHHDPNRSVRGPQEEKEPIAGNPNRDIWKLIVWRMTEDQHVPQMERALFASFCGNISALLPVCNTWEDRLWAYFRTLVNVNVELEIRSQVLRKYVQLPQKYWDFKLSKDQIFAELAAKYEGGEHVDAYHAVQRLIVLEKEGELSKVIAEQLPDDGRSAPLHLVRFFAHLVLFLRKLGKAPDEDACNIALRSYVKVLIERNMLDLVAFYVAALPRDEQPEWYALFLESVRDPKQRETSLKLASDAGLDVAAITQRVVENIRLRETVSLATDLKSKITKEDEEKIDALGWLIFYPEQRAEALWQANALIRLFLGAGKLEAAQKAFNKIPNKSVDIIMKSYGSLENAPLRVKNSIREHLCLQAYLYADDSFSDWFQTFHNARPKAPVLPAEANFSEKVAHEHREAQYRIDLDRWHNTVSNLAKTVKSRFYNVLLFPEGGWLVDESPILTLPGEDAEAEDVREEDEQRKRQMNDLRRLYIPKVVLLLHTVLHSIGEYKECVELANLLVSETHKLYKVYAKEGLQEVLTKLSESSVKLVEENKDPWGYPVSS